MLLIGSQINISICNSKILELHIEIKYIATYLNNLGENNDQINKK